MSNMRTQEHLLEHHRPPLEQEQEEDYWCFYDKNKEGLNIVTGKKTSSAGKICIINPDKLLGK